jgi:hypothetical protein
MSGGQATLWPVRAEGGDGRMREYDVALWLSPPDGKRFAAFTEEVEAAFPLDAVAFLMKKHKLSWVAYAAVGLGKDRGVVRFCYGVRIILHAVRKRSGRRSLVMKRLVV